MTGGWHILFFLENITDFRGSIIGSSPSQKKVHFDFYFLLLAGSYLMRSLQKKRLLERAVSSLA